MNSQGFKDIYKIRLQKPGTNLATLLSQVLFCPQLYYRVGMMLQILLKVTDLIQGWKAKKKSYTLFFNMKLVYVLQSIPERNTLE